jgi:hypothetical protein
MHHPTEYRKEYVCDVLTEEERASYNSDILYGLLSLLMDGYEENPHARTSPIPYGKSTPQNENSRKKDSIHQGSTPHLPRGCAPHSVEPGSLLSHFDALVAVNLLARSKSSFLVQIACRLVYTVIKANPLNIVALESFGIITSFYGTLAGLVNSCIERDVRKEKNDILKSSSSYIPVTLLVVEEKEEKEEKEEREGKDGKEGVLRFSGVTVCQNLDPIPLVFDISCILQYAAVITSEREDSLPYFLLHMALGLCPPSPTLSSTPHPPSSSSLSPTSSSSAPSAAASSSSSSRDGIKIENEKEKEKEKDNINLSPQTSDLHSDPLTRALQIFPQLSSAQYRTYLSTRSSIRTEVEKKVEKEVVKAVEKREGRIAPSRDDIESGNSGVEGENGVDPASSQSNSQSTRKVKDELEKELEIESTAVGEEVLCVLLYFFRGTLDDRIVSTIMLRELLKRNYIF